jgi:hypothetical protein
MSESKGYSLISELNEEKNKLEEIEEEHKFIDTFESQKNNENKLINSIFVFVLLYLTIYVSKINFIEINETLQIFLVSFIGSVIYYIFNFFLH